MSHKSDSVNTSVGDSVEHSVVAKLRRLKIEESLCLKNVNKISFKENAESTDATMLYSFMFKDFSARVRKDFSEINNMFEDIKAETEEKLSSLDIDNMKKDVIKLDEKLRSFKNYLQFELASLAAKEGDLNKTVTEAEELKQTLKPFQSKKSLKPFNIVPSPVKVLIKSPFKCKEVQEFQEFMKNSPNRYGGWNEYHHNIFVHFWKKYFDTDIEDTAAKDAFQNELLEKVSGATKEDIIHHQEWYSKYLYLKEQQQNALNKWKNSTGRLGKAQHKNEGYRNRNKCFGKTNLTNDIDKSLSIEGSFLDLDSTDTNDAGEIANVLRESGIEIFPNEDSVNNETPSTSNHYPRNLKHNRRKSSLSDILKPTKQWSNRCNSSPDVVNGIRNIECVTKLRTPNWRLALQN